jgi:phytoene dehydrogenase-like protein
MMFDAIVIGAGHNGLAAALRLAEKGWRVAVVEAKPEPGGAVKTRELTLPGFRHDLAAMNLSMFAGSPFFQAHKETLFAHGLGLVPAEDCFASVFRDGTWLGVSNKLDKTVERIAGLSAKDAEAWHAMLARFGGDAPHIFALLGSPMPSFIAARAVWKAWREKGTAWLFETLKMLLASPRDFLDAHFTHPKVKTMMAAWGLHLDFAPDVAGGALFPYLESMANQAFGMVIGAGGADTIIKSMVGALKAKGGELILGEPVSQVNVSGGVATGVSLRSGNVLQARVVIANVHPKLVFHGLVAEGAAPARYVADVAKFRAGPGAMMVHLALDAPLEWRAGAELKGFAYVHIAPDLEMMAKVYAEAAAGLLPGEPALVVGQPTAIDPSRAPEGKDVLWVQVRVLPAEIRGDALGQIGARDWDGAKEAYADRVIDIIERYAPGLKTHVLARSVFSPLDLEHENPNLIGGDSLSGSHHLDQNFFLRPVAGWSRYATPIKNLYLCGASTWPGAGTGAGSGFMLANLLGR